MKNNSVISTNSIKDALIDFALENQITIDNCDYDMSEVLTFIKANNDENFKLFSEKINEYYKDEDTVLNHRLEIKQKYKIIPKIPINVAVKLNYTLELGTYASHPKIILHPDSHILYKSRKPSETYRLLVREFNKIKALNEIIVGVFDESMLKMLKSFTKHLYEDKFTKKIRLPLFDGIEPKVAKNGKLIFSFKQKDLQNKQKVIEVEKDELLVEYMKPSYSRNGFNSYGEHINNFSSNSKDDLQITIDKESIYIEEDEEKKLYKSKCKGFVHLNEHSFSVDNKLQMNKLSRVENSLAKQEDNNIEVHVSQNDTNKDSIGEGVHLKSETIHVKGHVGSKSILEAQNLQIDGATHQGSTQFAKIAKINRHKGTVRCHSAKISLLEGGIVHATKVEIDACLSGTIYAQNVKIGTMKSNLKIYASESIEVNLVGGEDNLFKINSRDIPIINSKIDFLDEDIEDLKHKLENARRHDKSNVQNIQEEIKNIKEEILKIRNSSLTATITINKPLRGFNNIVFTLANSQEIIYKTDAKAYSPFHLNVKEDMIILEPTNISISL